VVAVVVEDITDVVTVVVLAVRKVVTEVVEDITDVLALFV
jgi:hypothetical protein